MSEHASTSGEGVTDEARAGRLPVTRLLDGRLLLRQPARGHRVGTDAVLLAAATTPLPGECVIDVGCGVGSIGLAVALRHRGPVRLIEREAELAALARENIALNGLSDRVALDQADLFETPDPHGPAGGDWVVSNPPFEVAGTGRPSPDRLRARAHSLAGQEGRGVGHGDWLHAMLRLAAPHATIMVVHRADALPDLLAAAAGRLGQIRVRSIHAHAEKPAIRLLFGGIVGSRAPFSLLTPLVLHEADGTFTAQAAAIHRGEATLSMFPERKSRPRGRLSTD